MGRECLVMVAISLRPANVSASVPPRRLAAQHGPLDPRSRIRENDLSFVNIAIPTYLRRVDPDFEPDILSLLVAFYDAVPPQWRSQLTWHPSDELRWVGTIIQTPTHPKMPGG
jgi:hypothetical protein